MLPPMNGFEASFISGVVVCTEPTGRDVRTDTQIERQKRAETDQPRVKEPCTNALCMAHKPPHERTRTHACMETK